MGYYEFLNKTFGSWSPLSLAILVDILMIIPFIDFIITVPLQWILWSKPEIENDAMKYINITYDTVADFVIPVVGDLLPMNTITVCMILVYKRIEK